VFFAERSQIQRRGKPWSTRVLAMMRIIEVIYLSSVYTLSLPNNMYKI
jgi:hypothetical protein